MVSFRSVTDPTVSERTSQNGVEGTSEAAVAGAFQISGKTVGLSPCPQPHSPSVSGMFSLYSAEWGPWEANGWSFQSPDLGSSGNRRVFLCSPVRRRRQSVPQGSVWCGCTLQPICLRLSASAYVAVSSAGVKIQEGKKQKRKETDKTQN